MTGWLRLWHDMPFDPKWRAVSRRSGQRISDVIAIYTLMLVSASQQSERGTLTGWSDEDAAACLDLDEEVVRLVRVAMEGKVTEEGRLSGWERRQPKREDGTAAERKAAWKERQNTARNALERSGTQRNAPDTDTDTDTEEDAHASSAGASDVAAAPIVDPPQAPVHEPPSPAAALATKITRLYQRLNNDPSRLTLDTHPVHIWASQGFDMRICEAVVLGKLEQKLRAGKGVRSLNYFEEDLREAHQKRAPEIARPALVVVKDPTTVKPAEWERAVRRFGDTGDWPEAVLGPPPGHPKCGAPSELTFRFQKQGSAA